MTVEIVMLPCGGLLRAMDSAASITEGLGSSRNAAADLVSFDDYGRPQNFAKSVRLRKRETDSQGDSPDDRISGAGTGIAGPADE